MTERWRAANRVLPAVALLSTALIAYEIVLMRRLLIERWHHFGYLVISAALLGFGASGTLLAVFERPVRRRPEAALRRAALGVALSVLLLPRLAALLPVRARFVPAELGEQLGWWLLYWLAAGLPFLLGAAALGIAIMTAGPRVGAVYGLNLFGSGLGAVIGGLLVSRVPIEYACWPSAGLALLATATLVGAGSPQRRGSVIVQGTLLLLACGALTLIEGACPLRAAPDEFKYGAYVKRLASQGSARLVARAADPHGYVEVYASPLFHDLPFLAIGRPPPPMLSIVINGDWAGSALCVSGAEQAAVMDTTLMALPYRLLARRPRVLLLGETGGTNLWLARRRGAERIAVVQANAGLVRLLRGPLAEQVGNVFGGPDLELFVAEPRAWLRQWRGQRFDLIQISSLEGLGLGTTGLRGLAEDHLLTVEGIAACLRQLDTDGLISVCRGIQQPPRENVRLLATFAEALEALGVREPGRHLVQVRDYLGVCTLALRSPLDAERRARLAETIAELHLTPVWYDGLDPDAVNRPDELPGPPGEHCDWLHWAARQILSDRREEFYRSWLTNVRPARDDQPFFWDFYKPGAVAVLREVYQDLWLTRAELGRLFLYASLVLAGVAAVVLILGPLAAATLLRRVGRTPEHVRPPVLATVLYFAAIGAGFMGIEMALISRAIRWLGEPVLASALVIGGLLVLSGVGSLGSGWFFRRRVWPAATSVAALATALTALALAGHCFEQLSGPAAAAMGIVALPLAVLMGAPLPRAVARLAEGAPALVPWAWGVNGVASVVGTSLAMVVAMSVGYRYVFALSASLYFVAGVLATRLGSGASARP